ncbi:hypothetical protein ACFVVL_00105 [Kitasatospora sp. NPDC058115]|uniref:hypothetical protein n=1 Tax=Kitasatospora sp. NPDC058115 TaxID=3346347 RepID=UPI0036D8BFBB
MKGRHPVHTPSPVPLVVPIEVDALLVNPPMLQSRTFERWQPDYRLLLQGESPDNSTLTSDIRQGVYLQWQLPGALRHSRLGPASGHAAEFPRIPNRWLVVRGWGPADGRTARGWIVESDRYGDGCTTPFLNPGWTPGAGAAADGPAGPTRFIGRAVPLENWDGDPHPAPSFVTAAGPGQVAFTTFQPHNENVLSLHDPLDDVEPTADLCYLVTGWHADPDDDPLSVTADPSALHWTVAGGRLPAPPNAALYTGRVLGLTWDLNGDRWTDTGRMPPSPRPAGVNVDVGVGSSSADALTALLCATQAPRPEIAALEALQYGLLDSLDHDGPAVVDDAVHSSWFAAAPGGWSWEIRDRDRGDDTGPVASTVTAGEEALLDTLDRAQTAHDQGDRALTALRRQLYDVWLLMFDPGLPDQYGDAFPAAVDPGVPQSLAARVAAAAADIERRRTATGDPDHVPWGDTPATLAAAADAYLALHGGDVRARVLRRVPLPGFHRAADPVVMLHGISPAPLPDLRTEVECRLAASLVTAVAGAVPGPEAGLPGTLDHHPHADTVHRLLTEFWVLDRALTAGVLAAAVADPTRVTGILPQYGTTAWTQPWKPLFLTYRAFHYSLPYQDSDGTHWTFDGHTYTWNGSPVPSPEDYREEHARVLLTPHAVFNLAAQVRRDRENNPGVLTPELLDLEAEVTGWDVISQVLGGMTRRMALRDPATRMHPYDPKAAAVPGSLPALLAGEHHTAPTPGRPPVGDVWAPSQLLQTRSGQFYFSELHVVDQFGQVCNVIDPDTTTGTPGKGDTALRSAEKRLYVSASASLDDGRAVVPPAFRMVSLRPRLLQAARLCTDWLSARSDDIVVAPHSSATQICGWLLPNHLDRALAAHGPDGGPLGELRTAYDDSLFWEPAPGSAFPSLDSLAAPFPHLHGFLTALAARADAGAAFTALLGAVDETLHTVAPLGGRDDRTMTVLVGRPLALVRGRLRFELDGPPLHDPSWEAWQYVVGLKQGPPPPPDFLGYPWNVRLGAADNLRDGLIGYFEGTDYGLLRAVAVPDRPTTTYLSRIGTGFTLDIAGAAPVRHVTMLVDPRAAVHAATDILPTVAWQLPAARVTPALARMEVSYRVGPLLARTEPAADGDERLIAPRPSTRHGSWTFARPRRDGSPGWTELPVGPADPVARIAPTPPVARNGRMVLRGAVSERSAGRSGRDR